MKVRDYIKSMITDDKALAIAFGELRSACLICPVKTKCNESHDGSTCDEFLMEHMDDESEREVENGKEE